MSTPVFGSVGADLYDRLSPLAYDDEANDFALGHLCQAIGLMFQEIADLSEDRLEGPGWSALVDVDRCPAFALPWLAARVGVKLTALAAEDVQRDEIRRRSGEATGRPAAMIAKAKTTLTGTQSVRIVERAGGNAWQIAVFTRSDETPDSDATLAAVMSEKPAGDILTHSTSDTPFIWEMTRSISAITANIDSLTLADVT